MVLPDCKSHFYAMEENVVSVRDLSKRFGPVGVIEQCSLTIAAGSIFGLVGLNGAGKTTLIRLLLGLLRPDGGEMSVLGHVPWSHEGALYRRLGVVLEHDGFAGNLSVKDNLALFAAAKGLAWGAVTDYINNYWDDTFIRREVFGGRKKVKFLSRGQKVQCGLCRAFLGWPAVCLFDEPTVALDVEAYDHFCALTLEARRRGSAVLISSHQLSTIEELCDTVGILDNKMLHFLQTGGKASVSGQWVLVADNADCFKAIIEDISGFPALYKENAWHCIVETPETTVPEMVARLVEAGCRIREVRPEVRDLKGKIRTHYENG